MDQHRLYPFHSRFYSVFYRDDNRDIQLIGQVEGWKAEDVGLLIFIFLIFRREDVDFMPRGDEPFPKQRD